MARTITEKEKSAQQKLAQIEAAKPKDYVPQYRGQMDALSAQLKDRKFSWDPDADALYRQYADRYRQQGRLAMKDSMGQTAALTGGYGNSYGSAVGQQTYDAYLQALSDAGLGIYDRAYGRFKDAGAALEAEYGRLKDLDDDAYGQYKDALDAWMKDRDYYTEAEDTAYQRALLEAQMEPAKVVYAAGKTDSGKKNRYDAVLAEVRALDAGGSAKSTIQSKIDSAYSGGYITENQKDYLTGNWGSGSRTKTGGNSTTVIKKPGMAARLA